MTRGVRWYLVGSVVLVTLTGCKQSWVEEREPWRHEAEEACLKTGTVKESPSVALLGPINGPGMCGADYPLKVAALGESSPALSYADEAVRPPGMVPEGGQIAPRQPPSGPSYPVYRPPPQYPANGPYPANTPFAVNPAYPADTRLPPNTDYRPEAPYEPPSPYPGTTQYPAPQYPARAPYSPPASYPRAPARNGPISLTPPGIDPAEADEEGAVQTPLPRYGAPRTVPAREPVPPRGYPANADEAPFRPDPRARAAPFPPRYPGGGQVVPLSPSRERAVASLATTASVTPAATLACPIVSALDRWILEAVQPAAQKWFGQPVTEIKQISAYSCRGMNGNPNAHISEHAFGNALDIAAFVLADGRKVTVEKGWHASPEEQGFLHDVQAAACELFTTVLAPGSNVYHYNHIHVDLMRRASGRRICQPGAIAGDVVAARVRARYAGSRGDTTGSIPPRHTSRATFRGAPATAYDEEDDHGLPNAIAGED
jgi:hypothetical protein